MTSQLTTPAEDRGAFAGRDTGTPFIHKFATDAHQYIYDVNSGEIFRVDEVVWAIMEDSCLGKDAVLAKYAPRFTESQVAQAYDEIQQMRTEAGCFSPEYAQIGWDVDREDITQALLHTRTHLTLNVTEQCNFRCSYCPYTLPESGFREHGTQYMSWEVAKAAIDDFLAHSRALLPGSAPSDSNATDNRSMPQCTPDEEDRTPIANRHIDPDTLKYRIHIGYYGGEPLLNFPLIRQCTEYILTKLGTRSIWATFGLTTNGYLLKDDIAEFIGRHRFIVRVSFDGPPEVHDRQRRLANGAPTWQVVKNNIQAYIRRFPGNPPALGAVVSYTEDLGKVCTYLATTDWTPPGARLDCLRASDPWPGYRRESTADDFKLRELRRRHVSNLISNRLNVKTWNDELYMHRRIFDMGYESAHRARWKYAHAHRQGKWFNPSVLCAPGSIREFVTVNGDYYPCERVQETKDACMGNVTTGIDIDKAIKMMTDFVECTEHDCARCWCVSVCPMRCWAVTQGPTGQVAQDKKRLCEMARRDVHAAFVQYCHVIEQNPKAFDYLAEDDVLKEETEKRRAE